MEDLESVFIYQEREHELKQKLMDTTIELETMKNIKTELFNLLQTAYQERDEARNQLQQLMNNNNNLINPIQSQDTFFVPEIQQHDQNQNPFIFHSSKPNPTSITESCSLSHGSSPVDSFFETVSSPEFSNNNNMGYLNPHQNLIQAQAQDFNYLNFKPVYDYGTEVIESLAAKRVLPQRGKLLQAVRDAGPLLQTVQLAGPLPTWSNPPPLQDIKVPSLNIKEYDHNNNGIRIIDPVSFPVKPKYSSSFLQNGNSSCSASSMLGFASNNNALGSWNNSWKLCSNNSGSSMGIQLEPRKRQRYQ